MIINERFKLSMVLDNEHFQKIFSKIQDQFDYCEIDDNGNYVDSSLTSKGITVRYKDSLYKKKIHLIVNTYSLLNESFDVDKFIQKLDNQIIKYFNHEYCMNDFTLSEMDFVADIDVGSRRKGFDYLRVLRRIGKVKGFSPVSYEYLDKKISFCLSGNSNNIDFLLYDLERAALNKLQRVDASRKQLQSVSELTEGILRAEVRLTKPKAIRKQTNELDVSNQLIELTKNRMDIFLEIFARIVPFGDFYKMDVAAEIIRNNVTDSTMRRKMLRLLALIPEKKSLHLAQKAMNCRDMDKVMKNFAEIGLSPVTISKRHEVKQLECLYEYILNKRN